MSFLQRFLPISALALSLSAAAVASSGRIVFQSDESGNYEIWIVNADGTGLTQLTDRPGWSQIAPKFSPDGWWVAYLSCAAGCELRIVSLADGTDRLVKDFGTGMYLYDWSRTDWLWVAVDTASGCWREEVRRIRPDGSHEETVVTELSHGAAEHPEGDKVLYVRSFPCWTPDNEIRIKAIGTAGPGDLVLARDGQAEFWPSFAHESTRFLFHQSDAAAGHSSLTNLYLMDEFWTSATRVTNATGAENYLTPVFSPDDQSIAAMFSEGADYDIVLVDPPTGDQQCLVGGRSDCRVQAAGNQAEPDWASGGHELFKVYTGGPDVDGDGEIDVVVTVGSGSSVRYDFTIFYGANARVSIVDTVPAEWDVVSVTPTSGTVDFFATGRGDASKSATRIVWETEDSSALTVVAETRPSAGRNGRFRPTSCGLLMLNDGAEAFEVDPVTGELVRDEFGMPIRLFGPTLPLPLIAVGDEDSGTLPPGYARDGTGDFDGDGLTDAQEVFDLGSDPCLADTDGDGVIDSLDSDPTDPAVQ